MTMIEPNEQKVWQSNKTRFLLYVYFSHFSSSGKQETSFWLRTHRIFSQVTDNHKIRTLVYGVRQTQPQRWNSFGAFGLKSTNSKFFERDLMVTSERQKKEWGNLERAKKKWTLTYFGMLTRIGVACSDKSCWLWTARLNDRQVSDDAHRIDQGCITRV